METNTGSEKNGLCICYVNSETKILTEGMFLPVQLRVGSYVRSLNPQHQRATLQIVIGALTDPNPADIEPLDDIMISDNNNT